MSTLIFGIRISPWHPTHSRTVTPVFGIALEIALGLPIEHRFAYLWLTAFIKTLIMAMADWMTL